MLRSGGIAVLIMLCASIAFAASSDELAKTKQAIEQAQAQQEKTKSEQKNVAKELTELQKKLVRSAANLQQNEKELGDVELKLRALADELTLREKKLVLQKEKLDGLSRIAIRLSRTPPSAMVLMPGDGSKRLQAASALSVLTKDMKAEAEAIHAQLDAMKVLQDDLAAKKEKAEAMRDALKVESKAFETALKERRKLHEKLAGEQNKQAQMVAKLAKKAADLESLIESIEQAPKSSDAEKEVASEEGVFGSHGTLRSFAAAKGKIRLPASGKLVGRFGGADAANDTSKGIKIETRANATVVTPYDAEVAYRGPFLNYGQLVILKHRGDYHTLLAGFTRIDVKVGDFLLEGEPIGAMGEGSGRKLYVELRENNIPVNPASWMRGL